MRTDLLHMLYEYWNGKYTPCSDDYDFWPDWLYTYFNELPLGEAIESDYIMWNSEQHRLTPKYDIMRSLATLVKHYLVTMEEDDTLLKITCQRCNVFVTFKGRSGELLYIFFLNYGFYTLVLYLEELDQENFNFQWPVKKMQHMYQNLLKEGNGDHKFLSV